MKIPSSSSSSTCPDCGCEVLFLLLPESKSKIIVDTKPIIRWVKVPLGGYALLDTYTPHGETCKTKGIVRKFIPFTLRKNNDPNKK